MKPRLFNIITALGVAVLLFTGGTASMAQLIVDDTLPLEDLIQNYFVGGCAEVSNVEFIGDTRAIGYFDGRLSNIGMDEGILLATGSIRIAPGPNNTDSATHVTLAFGDPQLESLVGRWTFNAAVLEFDFVSFKDTVSFEYVFGSEEYEEWVGSRYNDVFAFFVTGPGISTPKNIALIPGTTTPVAINTVNHISNSNYYIRNIGGATVQYDGFTTVLRAELPVLPCTKYHMKLAIADVSDPFWDSGVFLKAGSFNAGAQVTVEVLRDAAERACNTGFFRLTRTKPYDDSLTIVYTVKGTAANGVDYPFLPGSILIPPGDSTVDIPIRAFSDSLTELEETVIISIENACKCNPDSATLRITEIQPLALRVFGDTSVCRGTPITMSASATGGGGQYEFFWLDNPGSGRELTTVADSTRWYRVRVVDRKFECEATDSVFVRVYDLPVANAGPDALYCPGVQPSIGATAERGTPPYSYSWSPAAGLSNPGSATTLATPDSTTVYVVTVTDRNGCVDSDTVTVTVSELSVDAGKDRNICRGEVTILGSLAQGGKEPYQYYWSPARGLSDTRAAMPVATPQASTLYLLLVESADGCRIRDSVYIAVSSIRLDAGPDTAICAGETVRIGNRATTGVPPYAYVWTPSSGLNQPDEATPIASPDTSTLYILTAVDSFGCEVRDTVFIEVQPIPHPRIIASAALNFCEGDSVILSLDEPFASRIWSTGDTSLSITVRQPGYYYSRVTTLLGCNGISDTAEVFVHPRPEARIRGPVTVCIGTTARYNSIAYSGAVYTWSVQGGQLRSGQGGPEIQVEWTNTGQGNVYLEVSLNGCTASDSITVSVGSVLSPVVTLDGPALRCAGDSVILDAGAGYTSYLWSNGDSSRRITVKTDGIFSVTVFDAGGCSGTSDQVAVTFHNLPQPTITGVFLICPGDSTVLDAGPGYISYQWSTGQGTRTAFAVDSGLYLVTVSDSNGCTGTAQAKVRYHPLPDPVVLGPDGLCAGDTITLDAGAGYTEYQWSTGQRTRTIIVTQTGQYRVTVTDPVTGCMNTSGTHSVTVYPLPLKPVVSLQGDTLVSTAASAYQWYLDGTAQPGATSRYFPASDSGSFSVLITDANGCRALSDPFLFKPPDRATSTVGLPFMEAYPGERVLIPLTLRKSHNLDVADANSFIASISFDGNILLPVGNTPPGTISDGQRTIDVTGIRPDSAGSLAELAFVAMLGDVDSTPLRIVTFSWLDGPASVTTIDGEFRLTICRDGGDRLFDGAQRVSLAQNRPNPFNAMTSITYELIETVRTRLFVTDALGRTIRVLVDDILEAGHHESIFDAAELSSGIYYYILQTPGSSVFRTMVVVK